MKIHKSSLNKELNLSIEEFFDSNEFIFHLLFQIIVVVSLVNFIDSIDIHNYDKLKFVFIIVVGIIVFDYVLWTNLYQSLLFGLILLGYILVNNAIISFLNKGFILIFQSFVL